MNALHSGVRSLRCATGLCAVPRLRLIASSAGMGCLKRVAGELAATIQACVTDSRSVLLETLV